MAISLVFYPQEPNFTDLIERCCTDGKDAEFEEFRSAWHPYLEASLAMVGMDWNASVTLYEHIYDEYRNIFQRKRNPKLDYETYLLAVAYSHLAHQRGERSLRRLLVQMFGENASKAMSEHELYTLVFCAVLRMRDGCASLLLNACLPTPEPVWASLRYLISHQPQVPQQTPAHCIGNLKGILGSALC